MCCRVVGGWLGGWIVDVVRMKIYFYPLQGGLYLVVDKYFDGSV